MSKYQQRDLQAMARHALRAKEYGDIRYSILVPMVVSPSGLSRSEVERRIAQLAKGQ